MKTNFIPSLILSLLAASAVAVKADQDVITKSFPVKAGGKLIVNVDRGSLHITTSDSDKVDVKITRELKRASNAEAKKVLEEHKINLTSTENEVRIEAQNPQNKSF